MTTTPYSNQWIYRFSVLVAVCTFLLIVAGATVTSHRAGLSVPDWPTTYDQNMFSYPPSQWDGGIFYEHGHRLIASVVGMLTLILMLWLLPAKGQRVAGLTGVAGTLVLGLFVMATDQGLMHRIAAFAAMSTAFLAVAAWLVPTASVDPVGRRLGILALIMVIAQGGLGGLTVLKSLPALVSVGSLNGLEVDLCFSEPVNPLGATNVDNYAVNDPIAGGSIPSANMTAVMGSDPATVRILIDPSMLITGPFSVAVSSSGHTGAA